MSKEMLPAKPAAVPERRFPGLVTLGILVFLVGAVFFLRQFHGTVENGGLDEAAANLATIAAVILGSITLWSWFSFRSTYPRPVRRGVMLAGLLLVAFLFFSVRLEGITGNWVPTGWRWSWQQPRDFALAKPVSLENEDPAPQHDGENPPVEQIESTSHDFPQFLGPHRDGYVPDVQLSHDWKADPPQILWKQPVGAGWSGFTVVADRAVTLEQYGEEELVTCRSLDSGEVLWSHAVQGRHEEFMGGIGPRSTPTIHDSKVYTVGATGILSCLELSNGDVVWQDDLRERFGISAEEDLKAVMWGRSNSPLIYGDLCIVPAGGKPPVSLAAYDRLSGEIRWKGGSNQISYASPVVLTVTGKEQIVSVNESTVTGHNPKTGQEKWSFTWPGHSNMNASASQPHLVGDNLIFISKGYDEGSAVFQVAELGGEYRTELVWQEKRSMQTKFTNAVVYDGHAYGLSDGVLQCVDLTDGKRKWTAGRYGHGQILGVGDVLLVQTEKAGDLVMVALDSQKHRELGRFKTLSRSSQAWHNLCLAGKKLLVRNADEAVCVDLK